MDAVSEVAPTVTPLARLADLPPVQLHEVSPGGGTREYEKRYGKPPSRGYSYKGRTWYVVESEGE